MGGAARLYPVWATPDAVFPYLVNRIDLNNESDYSPVRRGTLYLDIWSNSPSSSEALTIRKRIMELLDNYSFTTAEVDSVSIWRQDDAFVPESTEGIWHYAIQMNMRITVVADAANILYR
jgi:hypothetical protein